MLAGGGGGGGGGASMVMDGRIASMYSATIVLIGGGGGGGGANLVILGGIFQGMRWSDIGRGGGSACCMRTGGCGLGARPPNITGGCGFGTRPSIISRFGPPGDHINGGR